jgi:hypothetical protein
MTFSNEFFFWPIIVLIGAIIVVLGMRFFVRLAVVIVAILLIWYCLFYVGLLPSPADYFKKYPISPNFYHTQ